MYHLYTDWQYRRWEWHPDEPELRNPEETPVYSEHLREVNLSLFAHEIMVASSFLGVPLAEMKTLDYGMGMGLWVRIAKKLGCDSYGLEVSEEHRDRVRRHGCGAITDEELHLHKFHFVNTEQVFEHIAEPLGVLRRISASLMPGGVVKISVPSGKRADAIIKSLNDGSYMGDYKTIMPVHPLEHINTYQQHTIRIMSEVAGLKVVRPSLVQSYSFLKYRGSVSLKRPRKSLKELVRPVFQWRNPKNIYMWLQKPR
jgi:SAM-dependent methyltransferase